MSLLDWGVLESVKALAVALCAAVISPPLAAAGG
jgi:hypothetical protein